MTNTSNICDVCGQSGTTKDPIYIRLGPFGAWHEACAPRSEELREHRRVMREQERHRVVAENNRIGFGLGRGRT